MDFTFSYIYCISAMIKYFKCNMNLAYLALKKNASILITLHGFIYTRI